MKTENVLTLPNICLSLSQYSIAYK